MTKTAANTVITKYAALLESEEFAVFALSPGYVGTTDTAVQRKFRSSFQGNKQTEDGGTSCSGRDRERCTGRYAGEYV